MPSPSPSLTSAETNPPTSNFATPANDEFYAAGVYKPLDPSKKEIRLVRLLPGSGDDLIVCELVQNFSLLPGNDDVVGNDGLPEQNEGLEPQDPPGRLYLALSYVAGSPRSTSEIRLEGRIFNVFRNLAIAMRRIRWPHATRQVFIDQICIDQSNVIERGRQVTMMGEIYSKSHACLAWIATEETDVIHAMAIETLERAAHGSKEFLSEAEYAERCRQQWELAQSADIQHLTDSCPWLWKGDADSDDRVVQTMNFYLNSYFTRHWVFPEVILPSTTTFMYGNEYTSRETVVRAFGILGLWSAALYQKRHMTEAGMNALSTEVADSSEDSYDRVDYMIGLVIVPRPIVNLMNSIARGQNDLATLITQSCGGTSTDPRDRFFSLSGLLTDPTILRPNYTNSYSLEDLVVDVFQAILTQ